MTIEQLDAFFPFFVFFYGALITFVLHVPALVEISEQRMPPQVHAQLKAHRLLAIVCLVVGGLWSLQNLWLG